MSFPTDLLHPATEREVVTLAGDRHGLRLRRPVRGGVEEVWSASTEPERLARWFGRAEGDLTEGGLVRMHTVGGTEEQPAVADLRILHCDAPYRLVVRWSMDGEEPSLVDLTLQPDADDRTWLTLEHTVLTEHDARSYGAGWEDVFARLTAALDGDDPDAVAAESAARPLWDGRPARPRAMPAVERTGDVARLTATHHVPSTPRQVWPLLSTAEGLRRWYVADVHGDLVTGGAFRCVFSGGDATGEVLECVAEERLVVSWHWDGTGHTSRMTVTLTAEGGGTAVRWVDEGAAGGVDGYAAGMVSHLLGLDRAARGLSTTESRWTADFVAALSGLRGRYTNPFEG